MLNPPIRSAHQNVLVHLLLTYAHAHLIVAILTAQARLFGGLAEDPVHLILALELLKLVLDLIVVTTPALPHAAAEGGNEST